MYSPANPLKYYFSKVKNQTILPSFPILLIYVHITSVLKLILN